MSENLKTNGAVSEKSGASKPPKYIMHEGYLYKRVPNKEIKESMEKWSDLSEMARVISGMKK